MQRLDAVTGTHCYNVLAAIFLFLSCHLIAGGGEAAAQTAPTIYKDRENFFQGAFGAYASPWSADIAPSNLKSGIDYENSMEVFKDSFPDRTIINWRWPDHIPTNAGVYGYMHVYRGNYDGGNPPVVTPPVQIKDLKSFSENVSFNILSGDPEGFNILNEFWLTRNAGAAEQKVSEIGFMLHTNSRTADFVASGEDIGTFSDQTGREWDVAKMPGAVPYIIFSTADRRDFKGQLDIKKAIDFLLAKNVVTGNEWINGIALGVEPYFGSGRLEIETWTVDFTGNAPAQP